VNQLTSTLGQYWVAVIITVTVLFLSGCGFKLRGTDLSEQNQAVNISVYFAFSGHDAMLERQIKNRLRLANITIVEKPIQSTNHLIVVNSEMDKSSIGIDRVGRNNEFEFSYVIDFVINNEAQQEGEASLDESSQQLEKKVILVRRSLYFDRNDPIGKRTEEKRLIESMQQEISDKLVRQFISLSKSSRINKR